MPLTDREIAVLSTKFMWFTVDECLKYLEDRGFTMNKRKYHRILKRISSRYKEIAFGIAKNFLNDHVDRVQEMINIKKLMYKEYEDEGDHFKRATILAKITEQNTYISGYSEDTKYIIEEVQKRIGNEEKTDNISSSDS
jgi:hypothetical protein